MFSLLEVLAAQSIIIVQNHNPSLASSEPYPLSLSPVYISSLSPSPSPSPSVPVYLFSPSHASWFLFFVSPSLSRTLVRWTGEWSGIPLFTPLTPHGFGMIVFFDAWGFSKEIKMVTLKIIQCAHLPASNYDASTSSPYVEILCNERCVSDTVRMFCSVRTE